LPNENYVPFDFSDQSHTVPAPPASAKPTGRKGKGRWR
jgi:hypothetical protein